MSLTIKRMRPLRALRNLTGPGSPYTLQAEVFAKYGLGDSVRGMADTAGLYKGIQPSESEKRMARLKRLRKTYAERQS
jgi:hypothetical protein